MNDHRDDASHCPSAAVFACTLILAATAAGAAAQATTFTLPARSRAGGACRAQEPPKSFWESTEIRWV